MFIKSIKLILFIFLVIFTASTFANTPGVYVIPAVNNINGGFRVQVMADNQGPFLCEIDTGSTNFMVPGGPSVCPNCNAPVRLTPTQTMGHAFHVNYASGRKLIAHTYTTAVQAAGNSTLPPVKQTIGLITTAAGNGNASPVLGMAQPPRKSKKGLTTYMQALVQAHVVRSLDFMLIGCPRSHSGTELVLGGPDPRLQNVTPQTVPLLSRQSHYDITPVTLGVAGDPNPVGYFNPANARKDPGISVDSGSNGAIIPGRLYNPLIAVLKQSVSLPEAFWHGHGAYLSAQQIAALPAITLTFNNNITLSIPSSSYVIPDPHNTRQSVLMIRDGRARPYTVFGDILLSAYAVEFNRSTESLRFYSNQGLCS